MSKNLGWRGIITAALIFIALLYLVPSLPGDLPRWWSKALPEEKIKLGLDLQGGMHLVLEVDALKAVENDLERIVEDIREDMRNEKVRYLDLKRDGNRGVNVTIMREEDREAFTDMMESRYPEFEISDGEPQEKGLRYKLSLKSDEKKQIMSFATDQALETIRNRIDQFGVTEPDIRPQEGNRILLQLPGINDPERAKNLIGQTAELEFKLVNDKYSAEDVKNGLTPLPGGYEILYKVDRNSETGEVVKTPFLVEKRSSLTGKYLTDARGTLGGQFNEPVVSLSFNNQGARIFERITGENVNKRLAIVLDDHVYSAPNINERISRGKAEISGSFSDETARDLAIVLRAGSLPAPVNFLEERTVGPSLGKDSINKGFKSMLIGGVIVVIFMVIYYGLSGVIADIALLLNILFIMAGLAFFEATLTLPGIAGIILTIGMAVDANVLIFERIREELKLGKTSRTAIESGYSKAIVTILDANVTTFIAALVLFQFGTGPVKGFAVTLSIGIVASFVTAVFVTRVFFDYLFHRLNWKKLSI
ncbi:protein translocase subunit SecD [Thermodesulfobacteriota bacterium]